jgi:hypothetical protein
MITTTTALSGLEAETDHHDIAEILLKVVLNTIPLTLDFINIYIL